MTKALENLDTWMKIESNVHSNYPNFLRNLTSKHGILHEHEIKICTLVLLKRDASEIAEIMGLKDVHAIHAACSQLRDKFGIEDEPLIVHLLRLAQ